MKCLLFAGPSLFGIDKSILTDDVIINPPIERGDLLTLQNQELSSTNIAIVDGYFNERLAVAHKEILTLLKAGFNIWGLSSMGALRAIEMENLGMKGYGITFNQIKREKLDDDEVCLLHGPAPMYFPMTEPLIHQRIFLKYLVKIGLISRVDELSISNKIKNVWFGYRTIEFLKLQIRDIVSKSIFEIINKEFININKFRIKNQDLENFISLKIWAAK